MLFLEKQFRGALLSVFGHAGWLCFSFCTCWRIVLWLWTIAFLRALVWQHSHTKAPHLLVWVEGEKFTTCNHPFQVTMSVYENGVEIPYLSMDRMEGTSCEEQARTLGLCSLERGRLRGALREGGQAGGRLPERWSVPQPCPCLGGTWTMPFLMCCDFWWGLRLLDQMIAVGPLELELSHSVNTLGSGCSCGRGYWINMSWKGWLL